MRDKDARVCYLLQPHLINRIKKNFGQMKQIKKVYNTLGTPRKILRRVKPQEDEFLSKQELKKYQSGVGSLLYLLKHSRPELSNPIRELSKCMTGANDDAMKEMYRVISWVLRHQDVGLRIAPKWENDENGKIGCNLVGIWDSTWGSDPDDGKSVYGYILYFMGVPVKKRK